jgi:hypothetical protein
MNKNPNIIPIHRIDAIVFLDFDPISCCFALGGSEYLSGSSIKSPYDKLNSA